MLDSRKKQVLVEVLMRGIGLNYSDFRLFPRIALSLMLTADVVGDWTINEAAYVVVWMRQSYLVDTDYSL